MQVDTTQALEKNAGVTILFSIPSDDRKTQDLALYEPRPPP